MNPDKFVESVVARESKVYELIHGRLSTRNIRLLHACMGICTEGGELTDALKKELFYGKEADSVNLIEELGDVLWYVALAADELGVSIEEIMERNNAKLEARYGSGFSEEAAENRNLDKEYEALQDDGIGRTL